MASQLLQAVLAAPAALLPDVSGPVGAVRAYLFVLTHEVTFVGQIIVMGTLAAAIFALYTFMCAAQRILPLLDIHPSRDVYIYIHIYTQLSCLCVSVSASAPHPRSLWSSQPSIMYAPSQRN